MPKKEENSPAAAELCFEEALENLEAVVRQLEDGQLPLAESLARYEEGIRLLKRCYGVLEQTQRRIELLNRVDQEGAAHCEPFDDRATALEEKAQARGRRRTSSESHDLPGVDGIDGAGRLF